ncbi:MAG: ornithine carbamoyltransferase [Candidatus Sumerlaeaceae bacterium]|jgi:ornithine carbamoyltransferase
MRDYLRATDFDTQITLELFQLAAAMKARAKRREFLDVLRGMSGVLLFQKPSLRTRVTFELAIQQLGGYAMYLSPAEVGMGKRESIYDVGKNLERWVDIVIARVFAQKDVEDLAAATQPPVINALSDDEHPCQAMADFFTLYEKGVEWKNFRFAYIGDGNNVCHSLMITAANLGVEMRVASPNGYEPLAEVVTEAQRRNGLSGGKLILTHDPREAVHNANAVYTDVWASMGEEHEAEQRKAIFQPYQVNAALMAYAAPGAFVMHDLPAHRGEEITDEVMDGPHSIIFDQAENRLHIQKAIILECLGLREKVTAMLR